MAIVGSQFWFQMLETRRFSSLKLPHLWQDPQYNRPTPRKAVAWTRLETSISVSMAGSRIGRCKNSMREIVPSQVPLLAADIPSKTPAVVASCSWLRYLYRSVAERQSRWPALTPHESAQAQLTALPGASMPCILSSLHADCCTGLGQRDQDKEQHLISLAKFTPDLSFSDLSGEEAAEHSLEKRPSQ